MEIRSSARSSVSSAMCLDGKVSREAAAGDYGVIFGGNVVDRAKTEEIRKRMRVKSASADGRQE